MTVFKDMFSNTFSSFFNFFFQLFIVEISMYPYENYLEVWTFWQCVKSGSSLAWRWYREFIFGFYATMLVTDAAKILVGEPRPHFFDTCKPDAIVQCNSTTQ